ncbi:hypothetical protein C8P63_1454 [Melghirimyces profundicolus]|uniref:Uncharacterized protein n=1 Tax=Melghirimyces profundicolus TaxID=1242148 RepID=A0A2T6AXG3_9BACL|nr:hypothetical protein [Melghirimyces profundicolus]PTX48489.1 hypothetical protein C8P63_1454 [Melghirimyces profundicolus]
MTAVVGLAMLILGLTLIGISVAPISWQQPSEAGGWLDPRPKSLFRKERIRTARSNRWSGGLLLLAGLLLLLL